MLVLIIGISVTIEVLQYIMWIGVTDITDVIGNTIGGIIGIGIYQFIACKVKDSTTKIVNMLGFLFVISVFMIIVLLQTGILSTRYFW